MKKLCAALLLCFSFNAFAITEVSGKIARLYVNNDGNWVFFSLKNDQCGQGIGVYYQFPLDSDARKAWFSMMLAAANTEKSINGAIPNCPSPTASVLVRYIYQDF